MPSQDSQRQTLIQHIDSQITRLSEPANTWAPADERIQNFIDRYLGSVGAGVHLPKKTFVLDRPGMARELSLPADRHVFRSEIVDTYRLKQGILHNPKNDRRTTLGVFHVSEGGLPIADDKIAVPKSVFSNLLMQAFKAPQDLLTIPYTSTRPKPSAEFISLLMRPIVSPLVEGVLPQKSMEIRFFAPGNLVGNLDFVESIFGNAGDPHLAQNDSALDSEHWTGHTGCVILAPHLIRLKKKDLGLPSFDQATERQRRDNQCWKSPDELYNGGQAFKVTARDASGVILTVIADNYFGYCKKEVKTQIGYAANLYGLAEEEHSGGALAFASYDLGEDFTLDPTLAKSLNSFSDAVRLCGEQMQLMPEGYGVDRQYPNILYVPENARFDLTSQLISWVTAQGQNSIKLLANHTYILPSGYKVIMKKQTGGHAWHLIGTTAEGVLCHKPCTVSGGGKSEISKSIVDAMIQGPVFTPDFHKDLESVDALLKKDYGNRFRNLQQDKPSRPVLSQERSLGSVIKLFTVSDEYTDEYNAWLLSIPDTTKEILLTVKRFYQPEWGSDWKNHFSVDVINGHLGHELKFNNRKLVANYLRVGREKDGAWRIFRVRQDFAAANKVQTADDITASVTLPSSALPGLHSEYPNPSVKIITNCEGFLFQRPDDAIYRGYDKQAEADIASPGTFLSNFEPIGLAQAKNLLEDAIGFDQYTQPMKDLLSSFVNDNNPDAFVGSSAHPRMVDGKPSKNPRYLQRRPDLVQPRQTYLAQIGTRLYRKIPQGKPVFFPVNAVLPGRRNNPPDRKAGVPALAVYNPIHYQELPELFMEFISSLTGKSPSTTGFGSEGAMTKGPFNALLPIIDLNNALVSFIVTGYHGFSSAAGHIGPNFRVDHDVSLLVPEIWCHMRPQEQDPHYLVQHGYLEKLDDFTHNGKTVRASLLGYRITRRFVNAFLGRIFSNPKIVFTEEMLAPEKQSLDLFAEGLENIEITMKRVAEHYFKDGSLEAACPPLRALLHLMKDGIYEGKKANAPEIRALFSRKALLESVWYRERLETRQTREIKLWQRHVASLEKALREPAGLSAASLHLADRLARSKQELERVVSKTYLEGLVGTIGADPFAERASHTDRQNGASQSASTSNRLESRTAR